jgi:hypothetical protein
LASWSVRSSVGYLRVIDIASRRTKPPKTTDPRRKRTYLRPPEIGTSGSGRERRTHWCGRLSLECAKSSSHLLQGPADTDPPGSRRTPESVTPWNPRGERRHGRLRKCAGLGKISQAIRNESREPTGLLGREMRRGHASVTAPQTDHHVSGFVVPGGPESRTVPIGDEFTALIREAVNFGQS